MKHNVGIEVISFTGKPFNNPENPEKTLTLKDALLDACLNCDPQEFNDGDKKMQVYKLVDKIYRADPVVDLSAEEVSLLKRLVGKRCTVPAVGAIYFLLENPVPKPQIVDVQAG